MRRLIASRVPLRRVPEIRLLYDHASERGDRVIALLDKIRADREAQAQAAAADGDTEAGEPASRLDKDSDSEILVEAKDKDSDSEQESAYNVFLEGVGDPRYDSDAERQEERPVLNLMPEFFPDASPLVDEMIAQKQQDEWQQKQKGKRKGKYRPRRR